MQKQNKCPIENDLIKNEGQDGKITDKNFFTACIKRNFVPLDLAIIMCKQNLVKFMEMDLNHDEVITTEDMDLFCQVFFVNVYCHKMLMDKIDKSRTIKKGK